MREVTIKIANPNWPQSRGGCLIPWDGVWYDSESIGQLRAENAELTRELHRAQDLIRELGGMSLTGEGDAFAAIERYWEEK